MSWLVSGGRWRAWGRSVLPYVVGPRVLEVGCGPGHLLVDLSRAGHQVVGIDRSPPMWSQASRRLVRAAIADPVIAADARALPFSNQVFDSVVMTFPTPVVRDPAFWEEAARVVRPGSPIVLVLSARSLTRSWPAPFDRIIEAALRSQTPSAENLAEESSTEGLALALPIPEHLFAFRTFDVQSEGATVRVVIALRPPV